MTMGNRKSSGNHEIMWTRSAFFDEIQHSSLLESNLWIRNKAIVFKAFPVAKHHHSLIRHLKALQTFLGEIRSMATSNQEHSLNQPKIENKFPVTYDFTKKGIQELFECTKKLDLTKIKNRSGDVVVMTGGGRGIGAATVKKLLKCDFHIVMGLRNPPDGDKLIANFREAGVKTGTVSFLPLDLKSLNSVREFGATVLERHPKIHILICNAGVYGVPYELTQNGFESNFQINYLAHFLLTEILLPRLIETAETSQFGGRIVNTSSNLSFAGSIKDISEIETRAKVYNPHRAYNDTKLAQSAQTNYLDALLRKKGANVYAYSLHPGAILTDLGAVGDSTPTIVKKMLRTTEDGADVIVCAAASPKFEKRGGVFLMNCHTTSPNKEARNEKIQKALFEKSCQLLQIAKSSAL